MNWRRLFWTATLIIGSSSAFSGRAAAHAGGLGSRATGSAPFWFILMVGGAIIAATFLFTSLLTDHEAIRTVNAWGIAVPIPDLVRRTVSRVAGATAVATLELILYTGIVGPVRPTQNFAILVVWGGWWAGYTMSIYLIGNTWSALNPWRRLASVLPEVDRWSYPDQFGTWPAAIGLLGMIWIEVVSPVADDARLLAGLIIGYSLVTLAGAAAFGTDSWFSNVDPITNVFKWYGRIAPIQRTSEGIELKPPITAAADEGFHGEFDGVAFVIALLWGTTYDGLVTTQPWNTVARWLVGFGVPPLLLYLMTIAGGFVVFLLVYRFASRKARDFAESAVSADYVERWLVPSLIPIAAGYHVAHYLGYSLSLAPAILAVAASPLNPPANIQVIVLPEWYRIFQLLLVLLGHIVAIWVAHSLSFELFPGSLQPIRSQYSFVIVMIFYTMVSMWIIAQPYTPPPFV